MIIDALSDLHGNLPVLPGGDLLILAGDYTATGKLKEWQIFFNWLEDQQYQKKVLIAGNHDDLMAIGFPKDQEEFDTLFEVRDFLEVEENYDYLCDSSIEFEGLKIWGSPWTRPFIGINPRCKHFTSNDETFLEKKFSAIPDDTDILITHGPPLGILDSNYKYSHSGDSLLKDRVWKVKPLIHLFGHIHEQGGKRYEMEYADGQKTLFMNVSIVDEEYKNCNAFTRIEL